jgi:hypothetical protein
MFVGVVFGVIGAVILIVGIVMLIRERSFLHGAETAEGTVIGTNPTSTTDSEGLSSMNYHAVVQFTSAGKTVQFMDPLGTDPPTYREGDTVKVRYDPSDPDHAQISSALRQWGLSAFLIVFGGAFFAMGVAAVLLF